MKSGENPWLWLLRILGVVTAFGLLWVTFRSVDAHLVRATLAAVGPLVLLAPLPEAFWLLAETVGWQWGFRVLGRHVGLGALFRVRLSMEAIGTMLPGGVLLSESLAPYLLLRKGRVPVSEGVTGVAARKFLLLASQAAYMLLMFLIGAAALRKSSFELFGAPGLEWIVLGSAVVLAVAALGVRLTLHRGAILARVHAFLVRLPWARLEAFLGKHRDWFLQTDHEMARFFGSRKRRLSVLALPFVVAWFIESVETWLLLGLVGAKLDFVTVASFEVVVVLLFRHVLFVLPAGLGAQDAGYVAFLSAAGVPQAVSIGAAFVVLKRGKELAWAAVGALDLLWSRGAWRRPSDAPRADLSGEEEESAGV